MTEIRTVLCPVDFSALSDRELEIATEICRTFAARLVLHHNLDFAPPGMTRAWEWGKDHPGPRTEKMAQEEMQRLMARISDHVECEATLSRGLTVPVLLNLVAELPAQVVVLGSHGWSNDDHASISDQIIGACPCSVLTIHDTCEKSDCPPFRLATDNGDRPPRVLVATDFSEQAREAVDYAFALARTVPIHLHLLHVVAPAKVTVSIPVDHLASDVQDAGSAMVAARDRLRSLEPADLTGRIDNVVLAGPAAETILETADGLGAQLIIMGRHARSFFKRFFTRDTSQQVLHRASCPVWFV